MLGFVAAGCLKLKLQVDNKDVEARLTAALVKDHAVVDSVHCPDDVPAKAGASFTCTVVIGGKPYERLVTITSVDKSGLEWETEWKRGEAILSGRVSSLMADELGKVLGVPVTIDCGEPVRFLALDRTVRCDLTAGAVTIGVVFAVDKDLSLDTWHLEPAVLSKPKIEAGLGASIREKLGPAATITCGSEPLILPPSNGIVWCTANVGAKQAPIRVEVNRHSDGQLVVQRWRLAGS